MAGGGGGAGAGAAWQWRVSGGPYLGEISALCLVVVGAPQAETETPLPLLLLAGTGSEVLLFDVAAGQLCSSLPVFKGVRIHGIIASTDADAAAADTAAAAPPPPPPPPPPTCSSSSMSIAVFGENSVKLFRLPLSLHPELQLLHPLPRFDHWVLDARFLHSHTSEQQHHHHQPLLLAVGLSDNSVALWHLPSASLLARVPSPFDTCLLYSLRLHGHSLPSLRIAAGTILNHILVWALTAPGAPPAAAPPPPPPLPLPIARLTAHHGSIFRLAWSLHSSPLLLLSASDDRTARIWDLTPHQPQPQPQPQSQSLHTFFGHHARIWDCSFSPSLIITAGEDCTCRLWAPDATQLLLLKHHM